MRPVETRYTDEPTVQQLIKRLFEAGEEIPESLRRELLFGGQLTAQALIAIVDDRRLWYHDAPGDGWAPVHAIDLLGERGEPAAVESLLSAVDEAEVEDMIYSRAIFALQKLGKPALEPTLEAIEAGMGPGEGKGLAEVLCELDVRDERILAILLEIFEDDPELGASYLASYGDSTALGRLHDAFRTMEVHPTNPFVNHVFTELAAAIEALGGELTPEEKSKFERVNRIRQNIASVVFGHESPAESDGNGELDADDPCWCGSGTKYKNCHGRPGRGLQR